MGCFNFEREEVLIFKLFGKCFEPTVWDGDREISSVLFREKTMFQAHRVGWRQNQRVGLGWFYEIVLSPPCGMVTLASSMA